MWLMGVALTLAAPAEAKSQTGAIVALSILGVILLIVPAVCFYLAGRTRAKAEVARNWASAPGTVTALSVQRHRSRNGSWYAPRIAYRFRAEGKEYSGKRLRFGWVYFKTQALAEAVIADYRVDGPITVRYDSNAPADNVITPEAETKNFTFMAWLFIGLDVVLAIVVAAAFIGKG